MGMIRAARVFDRRLLEAMFRTTPDEIVDGNRRPAEALILKCSFTHHKYPFLFVVFSQEHTCKSFGIYLVAPVGARQA